MKKLFAGIALGTMLMGGFMLAQDNNSSDVAINELEPSILSISKPASLM